MRNEKIIISFFSFILLLTGKGFAQQQFTTINGTFTEKADAEISIGTKTEGRSRLEAVYMLDSAGNNFSFRLPFSPGTEYKIIIKIMKPGHRRLEADKTCGFDIKPAAGQELNLRVTPSAFDQKKLTGLEIVKNINISCLSIDGHLRNWKFGGPVILNKVENGGLKFIQQFNVAGDSAAFHIHAPVTEEGFYYISTARWRKRVYAGPGDVLQVNFEGPTGDAQWIKSTPENQQLDQWEQLATPITGYGYGNTLVDYGKISLDTFTLNYQRLQPAVANFIAHATSSNKKFITLFKTAVELDNQLAALNLLFHLPGSKTKGFRPSPREFKNVPPYFKKYLSEHPVTTAAIMQTGEGGGVP